MRSHRPHPPPSSSSYPSSGRINIAASAPRLPVDNRISLNKYYRIADQILRQADIFRLEKNIIDLYIMLLRFSGLVVDTIPNHRDFDPSDKRRKHLKMKLFNILNELEELKPEVQRINSSGYICQNVQSHSPTVKMKPMTSSNVAKAVRPFALNSAYQGPRTQQFSFSRPVEEQFRRISLQPKAETLSRHSILGPNGLYGQWQPPRISSVVQYPSNIDVTPVEIPSLQQLVENGDMAGKGSNNSKSATLQSSLDNRHDVKTDCSDSEPEKSKVESILTSNGDSHLHRSEEPSSLISFEATETPVQTDIIRQPSPPAVLAEVQDLIPAMSPQVSEAEQKSDISSPDDFVCSEPLQLHISTTMMESFMKLAKSNTDRNLETCGVLAGTLKNRKFYVTALIIPKQESTPDSCQTTNEEEIFEVQDKRSLFPLGWIHTHPTQSCFMSSIDVHTHYSYQIMLPEAVAIVMAPRDTAKKHGIFRLTTPGGMSVIRQCQLRGFHPHSQPPDGGPIYKSCTDVYMNPNLKFDVIDLR